MSALMSLSRPRRQRGQHVGDGRGNHIISHVSGDLRRSLLLRVFKTGEGV